MQFQKLFVLSVVCYGFVAVALGHPRPGLTDFQLNKTLEDKATIEKHLRCATGEGACDPIGIRLRTLAPLVLRGACPQCSPQEALQIRKTLAYVQRNYPWEWAKILRQYG